MSEVLFTNESNPGASPSGQAFLYFNASGQPCFVGSDGVEHPLFFGVAGTGLTVKEGTNAKMGTGILVAGTVTISTNKVTSTSRIFLMTQSPGGTPGALYVSSRVSGTSFTVTSTSGADTSTFSWMIVDPA